MTNSEIVQKAILRIKASKNTGSNVFCIVIDSAMTLELKSDSLKILVNNTEILNLKNSNDLELSNQIRTALYDKRNEEKQIALSIL
jgi:hypothetical protein